MEIRNKSGRGPRTQEGKDEKQKCLTGRVSIYERSSKHSKEWMDAKFLLKGNKQKNKYHDAFVLLITHRYISPN